jgi:hypothetical protein
MGTALVVVSFVTRARADPARVQIDWPAVAGCPDARSVEAQARRAIPKTAAVDTVLAKVEVSPPSLPGDPWRVQIRTRTIRGAGERTLEGDSCAEVARAAALLVALAATRTNEPERNDELAELIPSIGPSPEPAIAPLTRPLDLPLSPHPTQQSGPNKAEGRFVVGTGAWAGAGLLPSLAWGPTLAGRYELGSWSVRLGAHAALPQDKTVGSLGATFDALAADLALCRTLPIAFGATVTTRACTGVDVGAIRARGKGAESEVAVRATVLPFVEVGVSWTPARRVHLGLDLRGGPSLVRPIFAVETAAGPSTLHEPALMRIEAVFAGGIDF